MPHMPKSGDNYSLRYADFKIIPEGGGVDLAISETARLLIIGIQYYSDV
jgi:hypothetical protein